MQEQHIYRSGFMSNLLSKRWFQELLAGIIMVAIALGGMALSSISHVEWPVVRLLRECKILVLGEEKTVRPQIDAIFANGTKQLNIEHGFKTTATIDSVKKIKYNTYLSHEDMIASCEAAQLTNFRKSARIFEAAGKAEISNEHGFYYAIPYVQLAAYDSLNNECGRIDNAHILQERINQQEEHQESAKEIANNFMLNYLAEQSGLSTDVATGIFQDSIQIETVNHTGLAGFKNDSLYRAEYENWFTQENYAYYIDGSISLNAYQAQFIHENTLKTFFQIGNTPTLSTGYHCFVVYNPTTNEWLCISTRSSI